MSRDFYIKKYFNEGFSYSEIREFLSKQHGYVLSLRHLKRIIKHLGLRRKGVSESSKEEICAAIVEEITGSGRCIGYKSMWLRLKSIYGLRVRRETVRKLLLIADPAGVEQRSRRRLRRRKYYVPGPNFLWHIDGYDKLKPFGFAIHGCIDGFSRKILWLNVATSNNKPEIVAYYYLKTIQRLNLLPTMIRSDLGTENTIITALQQGLRFNHQDKLAGLKSFIKGKSTSNQRIESYWCQLRRQSIDFWISLFKDMREINLFDDSNKIHIECLRYCFGPLIQSELNTVRHEWNRHCIRKQKGPRSPAGKPNCLFYLSEKYSVRNFRKPVDQDAVDICMHHYTIEPKICGDDIKLLVKELLPNLTQPRSVDEALNLYITLLDIIKSYE